MPTLSAALCAGLVIVQAASSNGPVLAARARGVLEQHCVRCHNETGAAKGGFSYLLDRERLIASNKVVPGDARESPLFQRVQLGEMPPSSQKARLTPAEVALLRDWIDAGAPALASAGSHPSLTTAAVLRSISRDLEAIAPNQRRFARYFSLAHLANAGRSQAELDQTGQALSRLLNSLSWHPRVRRPLALDATRTLYRIDLRDYQWNARAWDRLIAVYPYRGVQRGPDAQALNAATGCEEPVLRADWFVATAARPPLYYDLLQLPLTDRDLERMLRVDVARNLEEGTAFRAGFNDSGVSRNNRVIERHDAGYGAYWRSYDFSDNTEQQNIFDHPLGPLGGRNSFRPAGGEGIFHLPNGMLAYFLVDRDGRRIDRAPVEIVSDPGRPDRTVENGVSCFSCHARGFLPKADQVRAHVEKNAPAFSKEDRAAVQMLYLPEKRWRGLLAEDNARFLRAVEQADMSADGPDPITPAIRRYEGTLDLASAAGAMDLSPEEFARRLEGSPSLARSLGALRARGGTVQRDVFQLVFADLVRECSSPEDHSTLGAVASDRLLQGHSGLVTALALSGDGQLAVSGGADRSARLWDLNAGRELRRLDGHTGQVDAVAFSPDGSQVVTGGADRTLRLWETSTGKLLKRFQGHTETIRTVAFSPDGRRLVSGGADRTVRLWDILSGTELRRFAGHTGWVTDAAFSPDGRRLVSASYDRTVRLWDVENGSQRGIFQGSTREVFCVAFSPDGRLIAAGGNDGAVRLWQADTGALLRTFQGHANAVIRIAFTPGGEHVVSAASQYRKADAIWRVWDVESGQEVARAATDASERVATVGIGPDGRTVVSGGSEGPLRRWKIVP